MARVSPRLADAQGKQGVPNIMKKRGAEKRKVEKKNANQLPQANPRRNYTLEFRLEVVYYAEAHNNCQARDHFRVPRACVQKWRMEKDQLEHVVGASEKKRMPGGGRKVGNEEFEKEMIEYVEQMKRASVKVTGKILQEYAIAINRNPGFKASNGWLQRFMKRHGGLFVRGGEEDGEPEAEEQSEEGEHAKDVKEADEDSDSGESEDVGEEDYSEEDEDSEDENGGDESLEEDEEPESRDQPDDVDMDQLGNIQGQDEMEEGPEKERETEAGGESNEDEGAEKDEDSEDISNAGNNCNWPALDDFDFDNFEEDRFGVNEIESMDEDIENGMEDVAHPINDLSGDRMEVNDVIEDVGQEKEQGQEEEEGQEEAQGQAEKDKAPVMNIEDLKNLPVSAVFESLGNPGKWWTYYEGRPERLELTEEEIGNCGAMEVAKARARYLRKVPGPEADEAFKWRYTKHFESQDSLFWDYQRMSHAHTRIQEEMGLGPVAYIGLTGAPPPNYEYIAANKIGAGFEQHLAKNVNKSYAALRRGTSERSLNRIMRKVAKGPSGGCENPKKCVCNKRFELLFGGVQIQNLQCDQDGIMNLENFDQDAARMSIECSDRCECSSSCPRRQLQKGQKKPLLVVHSTTKGFTLRTGANFKAGEFISEYVGNLKISQDGDSQSYEAEMPNLTSMVVCSHSTGNITRFLSHSCDPNAVFVETISRLSESDPLLPKVSLYAIKDISLGDEITIAYYTKADMEILKDSEEEEIKCLCESPNCYGFLPGTYCED